MYVQWLVLQPRNQGSDRGQTDVAMVVDPRYSQESIFLRHFSKARSYSIESKTGTWGPAQG